MGEAESDAILAPAATAAAAVRELRAAEAARGGLPRCRQNRWRRPRSLARRGGFGLGRAVFSLLVVLKGCRKSVVGWVSSPKLSLGFDQFGVGEERLICMAWGE